MTNGARGRLLEPPDPVAVALQEIDHRIRPREMAGPDREHNRARLGHALLDPLAPVGVAPLDQRLLKLGRAGEVAVEALRDALDVAARPGGEHVVEFLAHAGAAV